MRQHAARLRPKAQGTPSRTLCLRNIQQISVHGLIVPESQAPFKLNLLQQNGYCLFLVFLYVCVFLFLQMVHRCIEHARILSTYIDH